MHVFRLGFLGPTAGPVPEHQAFFDALARLGYREGFNLAVERRFGAGDDDRLLTLAAELVASQVDVIVVQSTTATRAAKDATSSIPIVMGSTADALGAGLVDSLSHPAGNITGISFLGGEWTIKHVELLLELRPAAKRLGFLTNPLFLPEPKMFLGMRAAAASRGVTMALYNVQREEDYAPTFASMVESHVEGLAVAPNSLHRERRATLVALAASFRVPTMYGSRDFVEAGGLMSYGVDFRALWSKAAEYVDRIFRGARPADLPIEQPTKFELVINMGAVRKLDLDLPPTLLARADDVIE
jgi:putative ABC transport system substrate-binding protein